MQNKKKITNTLEQRNGTKSEAIESFKSLKLEEINPEPKTVDPVSTVETITPELAKYYLGTQKLNRKPTEARVKDYAETILRGDWKIGQPIQFATDGDLFDGQHRMLAVIRAGIPCDFLVVRGLAPETRFYVDIGQNRSASQIAQLMGLGTKLNSKLATCKAMFIGRQLKSKNKSSELSAKNLGVM